MLLGQSGALTPHCPQGLPVSHITGKARHGQGLLAGDWLEGTRVLFGVMKHSCILIVVVATQPYAFVKIHKL